MKRFTDAGRAAIATDNLYAALVLALMIPDICGSIEDPGPGKSRRRYERWCKRWLEPRFTSKGSGPVGPRVFISAADCYQIRCSLIHSGRSDIDERKRAQLGSFQFFDKSVQAHMNWIGSLNVNGVEYPGFLQLKADKFAEEVFDAADEWDAATALNKDVQAEKEKLLQIHPKGTVFHGAIRIG